MNTYTPPELTRFIEAAGESANIDAKGPMMWDSGEASAGLTKDILAFANSRDGGVIVIGKDEAGAGKFVLTGLTTDQAESFETTKLATWVNNRCAPPVGVVCYRVPHEGREFVVLTVAEFHDVPVICTKQFELPGKPAKVLLRNGAIYVRTANAESAPLSSIEDLRALIGLATTKRADQMLTMFQAMMKGQSLLEAKPAEELFQGEREGVLAALDSELGGQIKDGAWTFTCHPVLHDPNRWEDTGRLKEVIQKSAVRIRREFPPNDHNTHVREWGICNCRFDDTFGLTRSGYFMAIRLFRENSLQFRNPWQPNPDIPAGKWLDFKLNLGILIEFFIFLSRFAQHFEVGEELSIEIVAEPLAGRRLVTMDSNINLDPTEPCRASRFHHQKKFSIETLRAGWEDLCVKALSGYFELFSGPDISSDTFRQWIEKFKERRVD
ncbi:MAG: RNA-binding domain-containing protein [Pirellulales bacterium]